MPRHSPTPASKAEKLIEERNSFALGAEVDDLAFRRIEQQARGMMARDPEGAHTVLGVVAALNGRTDDVRHHFRIALQHSDTSAEVCCNFSNALLNLGETGEALEIARQGLKRAPDDLGVRRHVVTAALQAAHFREAYENWNQLTQSAPVGPRTDESLAVPLGDAVERGVFHEESVQDVLGIAHSILKNEGIRKIALSTLVEDATDADSFLYEIQVFASPYRAAELNEMLADRLADRSDLMVNPGTKFVPMFIGVQVDGGRTESAV